MRNRYRLFRRAGVYYAQDNLNGQQFSLRTKSANQANQLLQSKNQAAQSPLLNRELGRIYLSASDPAMIERTWEAVMREFSSHGGPSTRERCERAMRDPALARIRHKAVVETTSDDLLTVLRAGSSSTNHYLRRLHNLAIGLGWLNWPILAPKLWPKVEWRKKRGITWEEHGRIISSEINPERRLFYELLWEIGGSQTDVATLTADNIDWENRLLWYRRHKLKREAEPARITIGPRLEQLLRRLPTPGPLFPRWCRVSTNDRAAEFRRRCRILKIQGVSLHSYRYAWAQRAYAAGYPERFAQAALGHSSKAVHQAYAKGARVVCPPLETYERKIIPLPPGATASVNDTNAADASA